MSRLDKWEVQYDDEGQPCVRTLLALDKAGAIRALWDEVPMAVYKSARLIPRGVLIASPVNAQNSSPLPPEGPHQGIERERVSALPLLTPAKRKRTRDSAGKGDRALRERNPST